MFKILSSVPTTAADDVAPFSPAEFRKGSYGKALRAHAKKVLLNVRAAGKKDGVKVSFKATHPRDRLSLAAEHGKKYLKYSLCAIVFTGDKSEVFGKRVAKALDTRKTGSPVSAGDRDFFTTSTIGDSKLMFAYVTEIPKK